MRNLEANGKPHIEVVLASENDFEFFYEIKKNDENMYWSGHLSAPDYDTLQKYFTVAVKTQHEPVKRKIYMVLYDNQRCGYLYLDPTDEYTAYVSIAVIDRFSGKGIGKASLRKLAAIATDSGYQKIAAEIREDNSRSQGLFMAVGYKRTNKSRLLKMENSDYSIRMVEFVLDL